jgi:hypothetical protein
MATANQMMPLSGQPKRFSFHIETNDRTTQVTPRNTISRRLKALNVSSGCTASRLPPLLAHPVGRAKLQGPVIGGVKRSVRELLDSLP